MRYLKENALERTYVLAKPATAWALGGVGLFSTYSIAIYGTGDFGTSLLYAGRGIGAFISPLIIGGMVSLTNLKPMNRLGMVLVWLGYGLFAFTMNPWMGMLCAGIAHFGNAWAMSLSGLVVQGNTPDHVRGRVLALDSVGWTLTSAISNIIVAVLAIRISPQAGVLTVVGITMVTTTLWIFGTRKTISQKPPEPAMV